MSEGLTIILAGGGTGGHLYPGVAVAEALRVSMPGAKSVFLCTGRDIDGIILKPTGFEYVAQPIVPPHRSVGGLLKFWKSWRDTKDLVKRVLKEKKPAVVIGLGGYAAGVAVKLAAERRIATAILNPDVIPGKANQFLMRYARAVCCQFEQTAQHVAVEHRGKLRVTGCPIRPEIRTLPAKAEAAGRLQVDANLKTLLVTGASQGALTINQAMVELAGSLKLDGWQILHLSGRDHAESVRQGYEKKKVAARVIDFTPAMADVWAVTDLAVSRCGASTCAELTACGVPSVLIPYPFHKDLHQRANAMVLAEHGAAVLVDDERDAMKNAAKFGPILQPLLADEGKRLAMAGAAKKLGKSGAAEAVAGVIGELVR
jgi:UDP-N-acetylglucosamine--N-acetylmuramyl-(pentapeptide) pyrophosphoryl-undecaprenol N-acetylglucosamine transferase